MDTWNCHDPARLVAEVGPILDGDVLIALVEHPSTEQRLVTAGRIPCEERSGLDDAARARLVADYADRLCCSRRGRHVPQQSFVTILGRRGYTVFGPRENRWRRAWRYSNHFADAFTGELILVTEHGWASDASHSGGRVPSLGQPLSSRGGPNG